MKEYKVGEVFTTEDGKTVQCVRSNGLCIGCVFLTKIGDAPWCKAGNIDCSDISREDRQHVIFEELEELKEHMEYPVGKVLAFEGRAVEVVGNNDMSCEGCARFDYWNCDNVLCRPSERTDGKNVIFKLMANNVTEG